MPIPDKFPTLNSSHEFNVEIGDIMPGVLTGAGASKYPCGYDGVIFCAAQSIEATPAVAIKAINISIVENAVAQLTYDVAEEPIGYDANMVAFYNDGNPFGIGYMGIHSEANPNFNRLFTYDGAIIEYKNINYDFPPEMFNDNFPSTAPVVFGNNVAEPKIAIAIPLNVTTDPFANYDLYVSRFDWIAETCSTVPVSSTAIDGETESLTTNMAAMWDIDGYNYFSYSTTLTSLGQFAALYVKAVNQAWNIGFDYEKFNLKFPEVNIGIYEPVIIGQSETSFSIFVYDYDLRIGHLFTLPYDAETYVYRKFNLLFDDPEFIYTFGVKINNMGELVGWIIDGSGFPGQFYEAILTPIGPEPPSGESGTTKILTPISLPCTNPCIPMLRMK